MAGGIEDIFPESGYSRPGSAYLSSGAPFSGSYYQDVPIQLIAKDPFVNPHDDFTAFNGISDFIDRHGFYRRTDVPWFTADRGIHLSAAGQCFGIGNKLACFAPIWLIWAFTG
jgi:hypothetical protein